MDSKLIGSVLLIVGTSIGAGMLGLPIATAQLGFAGSLVWLVASWVVMTLGAFLLLEVNLWLPQNSNLISMAKATLGPIGQFISWTTFLLLLYSLLCAYISGGSDLFHNLLVASHFDVARSSSTLAFTALFATVVCMGIKAIDYVNRSLMFVKLGAFFLLVFLLMPFVEPTKLADGDLKKLGSLTAIMVTITAFGYASIIPSLRIYFAGNVHKLKLAIVIGSLIPLICYILWDLVIMGVIPLAGEHGMISILHSPNATSDMVNTLNGIVANGSVTFCTKLFTSICVVTSFLGVSLCLSDFMADALRTEKKGMSAAIIYALTFIPPVAIVLFFPNAFIKALEYAGIYCVVLLILLPAWMAWNGRYRRGLSNGFTVPGGKTLLIGMFIFSVLMLVKSVMG